MSHQSVDVFLEVDDCFDVSFREDESGLRWLKVQLGESPTSSLTVFPPHELKGREANDYWREVARALADGARQIHEAILNGG